MNTIKPHQAFPQNQWGVSVVSLVDYTKNVCLHFDHTCIAIGEHSHWTSSFMKDLSVYHDLYVHEKMKALSFAAPKCEILLHLVDTDYVKGGIVAVYKDGKFHRGMAASLKDQIKSGQFSQEAVAMMTIQDGDKPLEDLLQYLPK